MDFALQVCYRSDKSFVYVSMRMRHLFPIFLLIVSCTDQESVSKTVSAPSEIEVTPKPVQEKLELTQFYEINKGDDTPSRSIGSVSNGKLKHGKLLPFYGDNYTYFDKVSYLSSRGYTSDLVSKIVVDSYADLKDVHPNRKFYLMEMSNKEGGKIAPHRTHQNGLSVDFMMPKLKNGKPDYSLDTLGRMHYLLEFNDNGEYEEDTDIKIDFDLIAEHILMLDQNARKYGSKIEKVIIKVEYKDELFSTPHGKKLKESGIYVVKGLSSLINRLHDDHYHIDFKKI